jgi:hypothetical protein
MTMRKVTTLREEIAAHEAARGKRYDTALKARVIAFAERRRGAGHSWEMISTELGMCFETLRRWCVDRPSKAAAMKTVKVIDAPSPGSLVVASRPSSPLSVVSPGGLRIEGITLDEVIALLRVLG